MPNQRWCHCSDPNAKYFYFKLVTIIVIYNLIVFYFVTLSLISEDDSEPSPTTTPTDSTDSSTQSDNNSYSKYIIFGIQLCLHCFPICTGLFFTCFDCDAESASNQRTHFEDPFATELDEVGRRE